MTPTQFHKARTYATYYAAMSELADELFDKWGSLTKDELFVAVMKKLGGRAHPEELRAVIDGL